jgi:O-antigen ligase
MSAPAKGSGTSSVAVPAMRRPLRRGQPSGRTGFRSPLLAAGLTGLAVILIGLCMMSPSRFGLLLCLGGASAVGVILGLRSPVLATTYLLAATFFRLAIPSGTFPVDPFLPAFGGVVLSTWLWVRLHLRHRLVFGPIEAAIALYVAWNVASMIAPHAYPAGPLNSTESYSLWRFVFIGTVMPLTMFVVGRIIFANEQAIRRLMWALIAAGGYSALVSIMQFDGPASLVWPRYIINNPNWEGRANGVFNQPVVNGLVLIVGFLVAVLIASHKSEPRRLRLLAAVVAVASAYAVYLTHTRAVWLSFVLVVICGAVTAKGFRTAFLIVGLTIAVALAVNWSTFTSSDREAGGVGSPDEVQDRLNTLATSIWAIKHEPLVGWGIGRFTAVNTYHHQRWSPETPWQRGYGISSHFDILGIFSELGIVGLVLWLTIIALVLTGVLAAFRRLPEAGMFNRPFAWTALMSLAALITTGLTVDLRFFDFPNIIVWLLAGAAIGLAPLEPPDSHAQPVTRDDHATPRRELVPR